ncbi:TolC family protein [Undibacterium arcticum]
MKSVLRSPLFDWGGARTRKAESLYMAAVNRTADTAIRARSEVREAYSAYRTAYDISRHYRDEIVPLRKKISDEIGLRYNGMLTGVFELLADAREQANSVNAAIEAQRDYWVADTALQFAINGGGTTDMRNNSMASDAMSPR